MLKMWKVNDDGQMDVGQRMISITHFSKTRGPKSHLSTISHLFVRAANFVYSSAWKHNLGTGRWDLVSCQVFLIPFSCFWGEVENVSANKRPGRPSCLNRNFLEEVGILLPVKFNWIPFNAFRGEEENVSANQRLGRPSFFSDRPKKHKLGGH